MPAAAGTITDCSHCLIREYREFLEAWVHEIKAPITSARLAAENEKSPAALRIDDSLRRIDNLVELILYYARSEAP